MGRPLMADIHLKYVHAYQDKKGRWHHYFRRRGKNARLPGEPGGVEYMAAYHALIGTGEAGKPVTRTKAGKGTFAAVASAYYASPHFKGLSASSRMNYKRVIDGFLADNGHRLIAQFHREHATKIIGRMSDRPGAAIVLLKRIRTLVRFALEMNWIAADPTHKVRSYKSSEIHTWTEEEIAQFEEHWPLGSKQRLAFALCLYTGQRGSDVHRMSWSDIAGGAIKVAQQKTKAKLSIPLHPELQKALVIAERKHHAILVTPYGRPYTVKGFGNYVSDAISEAGLPERCKAHGWRKAAARRLAEAGCSEKQIASITGHKTLAEVARYTRAANQEMLAKQAMAKQVENTEVAIADEPIGYQAKNVSNIK